MKKAFLFSTVSIFLLYSLPAFTQNVGIGVSNPISKLHIQNGSSGGSFTGNLLVESGGGINYMSLLNTNAGESGIWFSKPASIFAAGLVYNNSLAANGLVIKNSTANLTLANNGNIGIGQYNPGFPLNFSNDLGDKISLYGNSGNHYGFGVQGGTLQMYSDAAGADIAFGYGSSTSFTELMRIKGNGYVGIGATDPSFKLDIPGRVRLRHSAEGEPGIWLNNSDNTQLKAFVGLQDDNFVGFYTSAVGWGGLKMSTTTGNIVSGAHEINQYPGNIGLYIFRINGSGFNAKAWGLKIDESNNNLYLIVDGIGKGSFDQSTGFYTALSDAKYKKDIHLLSPVLSKVMEMKPVNYHMITQTDKKLATGFIAQELKELFPDVVKNMDKTTLGITYNELIPVAFKAIQEQQQLITNQQKQINHQEQLIETLFTEVNELKRKSR